MTDEAPKRIWAMCTACNNWDEPIASPHRVDHFHEYLRADHAHALVAEAYEVAAKKCVSYAQGLVDDSGSQWMKTTLPDEIRALTPADAIAARDALIAEVRRKALKEAAGIVRALAPTIEHDSTQDDRMHESILERAARHIERAVE